YNDLKDNPEFLQDYAYILREFCYLDKAQEAGKAYLKLVPDDIEMSEWVNNI
ncbi:hypothetical protein HK332_04805, partial [Streptococcus agalactiae]|nr:hypothetical protein [Streptococcus agalactiae]